MAAEPPPDELPAGPANERPHFGVTPLIVGALHEDQPRFACRRGTFELTLRRRETLTILNAIFVAKDAEVNRTPIHLGEIDGIRPAVAGGQILEKEHGEESAE
jgi:hypothetical protein